MGRFVKNTVFDSGNYALGLAATSSSFRPNVAGVTGQTALRYSTTNDKLEYYSQAGNVWQTVSNVGTGTARITKDSFSGNSLRSNYGPLSFTYAVGTLWTANILVHVGTVYQIPGTNYSFAANAVNGALTDISFGSNPSNLADITIIHGLNSTIAS
jgi:hypothetical protein